MKLFDEDSKVDRRIFLDIIEAQGRRELDFSNPQDIPFLVSSLDPRELCGNGSTSRMDAHVRVGSDESTRSCTESKLGDSRVLSDANESVFGCLLLDVLSWEGERFMLLVMMY